MEQNSCSVSNNNWSVTTKKKRKQSFFCARPPLCQNSFELCQSVQDRLSSKLGALNVLWCLVSSLKSVGGSRFFLGYFVHVELKLSVKIVYYFLDLIFYPIYFVRRDYQSTSNFTCSICVKSTKVKSPFHTCSQQWSILALKLILEIERSLIWFPGLELGYSFYNIRGLHSYIEQVQFSKKFYLSGKQLQPRNSSTG